MFKAAVFAANVCEKKHGCFGSQHTPCLQKKIMGYFNEDDNSDISNKMGQSRLILVLIALTFIIIPYNTWVCKL